MQGMAWDALPLSRSAAPALAHTPHHPYLCGDPGGGGAGATRSRRGAHIPHAFSPATHTPLSCCAGRSFPFASLLQLRALLVRRVSRILEGAATRVARLADLAQRVCSAMSGRRRAPATRRSFPLDSAHLKYQLI